jgi:hypothetical protein
MSVIAKQIKIRSKGKDYNPGETIDDLTKKEENRLIKAGYAEAVKGIPKKPTGEQPNGMPPDDDGEQGGPDTGLKI